jgi:RND family efflux transporter MFP subunit
MAKDSRRPTCRALIALPAVLLLAACDERNSYVAPPPPKVIVAHPVQQPVTNYLEITGNTAAVNSVDLVARVQGFLQEIHYKDGDFVKKGTVLFAIEPEPYQVKLDQAKAAEDGAAATLKQAEAEYQRQSQLASRDFASRSTLESALATRDSARSTVMQAKANTRTSEINLSYTQVTAPFDGIVTARLVSIGELVGTSPTQLATIVQLDPIYVNFNISEQDVLRVRAEMRRPGLTPADL